MSNVRHGMSKTKLYHVWDSMNQRCNNPKASAYHKYGAKGVTICEEWKEPYKFMGWALLNGYQEGLTIERLDVHQGYCPSNCTWIPGEDQHINKRISKRNTSGYVGVNFHKGTGKWAARVTVNGKRKQLGRYDSAELANQARLDYLVANNMGDHVKAYELQQKNK